ncbi:MAG TPA: hypothetical protein VGP63_13335 [Planctomycetaceae bacterium]|nr:hypothetical protein [Planctomycetaceae bacterium]
MTDKPEGKRWGWKHWGWTFLAVLVLYPLSVLPVCLTGAWLVEWHVISREPAESVVSTVYAPLAWLMEHSSLAQRAMQTVLDPFEPLAPPHR